MGRIAEAQAKLAEAQAKLRAKEEQRNAMGLKMSLLEASIARDPTDAQALAEQAAMSAAIERFGDSRERAAMQKANTALYEERARRVQLQEALKEAERQEPYLAIEPEVAACFRQLDAILRKVGGAWEAHGRQAREGLGTFAVWLKSEREHLVSLRRQLGPGGEYGDPDTP